MFKKAQVGDTITWVIATLIIIVILIISVYIAGLLGNLKTIGGGVEGTSFSGFDFLATKSFYGFLVTDNFYSQIKTEQKLTEPAGTLAKEIFPMLYGNEGNKKIWLGVVEVSRRMGILRINGENDFFGSRPDTYKSAPGSFADMGVRKHFDKMINFSNNKQNEDYKSIELLWIKNE